MSGHVTLWLLEPLEPLHQRLYKGWKSIGIIDWHDVVIGFGKDMNSVVLALLLEGFDIFQASGNRC